jgi:hypothetical protein
MRIRRDRRWTTELLRLPESGMGVERVDILFWNRRKLEDVAEFNAPTAHAKEDLMLRVLFVGTVWRSLLTADTLRGQEIPRMRKAIVELRIGELSDERSEFVFGEVRGIAIHPDGRILVADGLDHDVRVFSASGAFLFAIGRRGSGPGEFIGPCCLTFSRDGQLWVKDFGNNRYSVFALERSGARLLRTVMSATNPVGFLDPISWSGNGFVDLASGFDAERREFRLIRSFVDEAGKARRVDTLPEPSPDQLASFVVGSGQGSAAYAQPFGSKALHALGPNGEHAFAASGTYSVRWDDSLGRSLRVVKRMMVGPKLSAAERGRATRTLEGIARQTGVAVGRLPFGVPSNKPSLDRLGFDSDGRLWVQRTSLDGQPREADVYARDGEWIAQMRWPANVRLDFSSATLNRAAGVEFDGDGQQRVVRLRFDGGP